MIRYFALESTKVLDQIMRKTKRNDADRLAYAAAILRDSNEIADQRTADLEQTFKNKQ